ncbi:hypothetical protein [Paenibacillus sp. sgz500992]|uniref:hypothetical protein n=1 Tax=Paenibacillus sp. sgz500992 TaxID=3242476 RepID=UPI0036D3AC5C
MLDYDFHYKQNLELFKKYKDEFEFEFQAQDMCRRFYVSMVNNVLMRTFQPDEEKLIEIKAINDALNDSFPA